ncbi:hypothetical protein PybrP1_010869, partial [[Pythium] brassicae (nom. inval.)]
QQQLQRSKSAAHWAEVAKGERRRRRASERQNTALRESLFVQRSFLVNFKSLLASNPGFALSSELNLHELLHSVMAPSIVCSRVKPSATTVGATQKSVFTFDTNDMPRTTMFAMDGGAHKSAQEWPRYTLMGADSAGDSPATGVYFEASTFRFRSVDSGNLLAVESRTVMCVRATDQY